MLYWKIRDLIGYAACASPHADFLEKNYFDYPYVQISMLHAMLRAATSQGFETNLDHIRINDVLEDILRI